MHIGIDASALSKAQPTGVENYAKRLLYEMMRQSQDGRITLYSPSEKPSDIVLPKLWTWKKLNFFLPKGWTHVRLSYELITHPPDVFFAPAHELPVRTARKTRLVTTIHDVAFLTVPNAYPAIQRARMQVATASAVDRAQTLLCVSEATKGDLLKKFPNVLPERITPTLLAPCWETSPSPQEIARVREVYQLKDAKYIVSIGRLEKKKNQETLIKAFEKAKGDARARDLQLVLIGKHGYGGEKIDTAVRSSPYASSMHVLGHVSEQDARALLAGSACFAFPSLAEGFGIPVADAAMYRVPMVTGNLPVYSEIIGEHGALFVSPEDADAWCSAILETVYNPSSCVARIASAHAYAEQLSWADTAKKTWSALLQT